MTTGKTLITGATGFVGGAVALHMLNLTDDEIICSVRGPNEAACTERLHHALTVAAQAYGMDSVIADIANRCVALPGDLLQDDWVETQTIPQVDLLIHSAASLKYEDRDAEEIVRVNIDGARRATQLATMSGAGMHCQISTAYVAGTRTGVIYEHDPIPNIDQFNNFYEKSKAEGEEIVRAADVPCMIVRPSIVIGHSETYGATSFSGMYGMVDEVMRFRRVVSERLGNYLQYNPVRILARPDALLNIIPIDVAAAAIARLALSRQPGTYHVVNTNPPTVGDCLEAGFQTVGLLAPRYADDDTQLSDLDRRLQTGFYDSYIKFDKGFDAACANQILGETALHSAITHNDIRNYVTWYLESGQRRGRRLADREPSRA